MVSLAYKLKLGIGVFSVLVFDSPHVKGNEENMTVSKGFGHLKIEVLIGASAHE